jgi:dipeptidyl aminopeptidase/acylaminoacyl peptidase
MAGMIKRLILAAFLALAGCEAPASPGAVLVQHPNNATAKVEYFSQRPRGDGPWPTVIFLHGHQPQLKSAGGRAFVDWGVLSRFADEGYLAVAISLPGYGNSTGPRDFAGPYTQNAVLAVIQQLENEKQALPDKIAIQGTSLGAVTAALIGAQEQDLAGLVLISGLYDLSAFFKQRGSSAAKSIRAAAIAQTGGDADALKSRSALYVADKIKAKTLILNGALDERTDPSQAVSLAQKINAAGGNATAQIFPNAGHQIPLADREEWIHPFIDGVLKPESAADSAKNSLK